jgi:hypothetical protein
MTDQKQSQEKKYIMVLDTVADVAELFIEIKMAEKTAPGLYKRLIENTRFSDTYGEEYNIDEFNKYNKMY